MKATDYCTTVDRYITSEALGLISILFTPTNASADGQYHHKALSGL